MIEPLACSNQPVGLAGWVSQPKGPRGAIPDNEELPPKFTEGAKQVEEAAPIQEEANEVQEAPVQAEEVSNPAEDWRTPVAANEHGRWIEFPDETAKKGFRVVPVTLGVTVHMKDGSKWYRHNRTMTWTRTRPPTGAEKSSAKMSFPGTGVLAGEVKDPPIYHPKLVRDALAGKWPGRKLLDALNWGLDHAEP